MHVREDFYERMLRHMAKTSGSSGTHTRRRKIGISLDLNLHRIFEALNLELGLETWNGEI